MHICITLFKMKLLNQLKYGLAHNGVMRELHPLIRLVIITLIQLLFKYLDGSLG